MALSPVERVLPREVEMGRPESGIPDRPEETRRRELRAGHRPAPRAPGIPARTTTAWAMARIHRTSCGDRIRASTRATDRDGEVEFCRQRTQDRPWRVLFLSR